jgi:tRNA modification GTPase
MLRSLDSVIDKVQELIDSYSGGRILKEGFKIAIAGKPNAGKSSLFNLLLHQERALVTPTPGTTRDYLSEWIDLDGIAVNLIDTAGMRKGGGQIEKAGQISAKKLMDEADLILWMVDLSLKNWQQAVKSELKSLNKYRILLAGNKIDLVVNLMSLKQISSDNDFTLISCKTKKGIRQLRKKIISLINVHMPDLTSGLVVTSARHKQKLQATVKSLRNGRKQLKLDASPEIIALELRLAIGAIDEITGKVYNEEILEKIFSKFCIGK